MKLLTSEEAIQQYYQRGSKPFAILWGLTRKEYGKTAKLGGIYDKLPHEIKCYGGVHYDLISETGFSDAIIALLGLASGRKKYIYILEHRGFVFGRQLRIVMYLSSEAIEEAVIVKQIPRIIGDEAADIIKATLGTEGNNGSD